MLQPHPFLWGAIVSYPHAVSSSILFRVCLTDAYEMVISIFPVFQISGLAFSVVFFFPPLPTLWNFFPSQVPLDLAVFITSHSFLPPKNWMEMLSNVSLPLVLGCPATPYGSLLLLATLFLASVALFFFNPMAHLPFHILSSWWRQPRLVWYIYFADSHSQWELGWKLVGELGPKWLLETGQSAFSPWLACFVQI